MKELKQQVIIEEHPDIEINYVEDANVPQDVPQNRLPLILKLQLKNWLHNQGKA